jgi:hypothetical protein
MLITMEGFRLKEREGRVDCGSEKANFTLKFQKGRGLRESI